MAEVYRNLRDYDSHLKLNFHLKLGSLFKFKEPFLRVWKVLLQRIRVLACFGLDCRALTRSRAKAEVNGCFELKMSKEKVHQM